MGQLSQRCGHHLLPQSGPFFNPSLHCQFGPGASPAITDRWQTAPWRKQTVKNPALQWPSDMKARTAPRNFCFIFHPLQPANRARNNRFSLTAAWKLFALAQSESLVWSQLGGTQSPSQREPKLSLTCYDCTLFFCQTSANAQLPAQHLLRLIPRLKF